jgi:UDP-GlcNAc:undecaprenyl-phosphate/decaprenyl-phosphate GlcNAc-1-phosphate transferase
MIPILPFFISLLFALVLTPAVIFLYTKQRWLDDPTKNPHPKVVHTRPLPRGGGVVIFLSVFTSTLLFTPIDKHIIGILAGGIVLMCMGIWDDIHDSPPISRLVFQILAALIVIGSGIGISYITNPLGGIIHLDQPQIAFEVLGKTHTIWIISDILALIWIVWCMNIVNFSKGLDGQMPGFVAISAIIIAILSLRFSSDPSQLTVTTLSMIVAGAFTGFLVFNFYPQKIMSGFGASTLAGYFLSILALLSGAKLATAVLVLGIPMIDAAFVIIGRLKNKRSPFVGDRSHLHHKLMDLGWGKRRIAIFYWASAALLGILALQLNSEQKLFTIVLVATLIAGFFLWLRFYTTQFGNSDRDNG